MLHDIVEVKVLNKYNLLIKFENNFCGEIDVSKIISFNGIFAPLKNQAFFKKVKVDPELGTIVWSNGADLAPETIYLAIKEKKSK